ncbi:hypothetical protein KCU65_g6585, partial [Aureobasidium melanogenum]
MASPAADYKWLWCDDHTKVTNWFLGVTERHDYDLFYASFVNTANKYWSKSLDPKAKKLLPLEMRIIDCLLKDPIPADALIDVLKDYNRLIGGTKGDLKSTGLVKWSDEPPTMAAIETGAEMLYKHVAATRRLSRRAHNSNIELDEDEEMQDIDAQNEQPTPSVESKAEHTVKFGILPVVGGKKGMDEDEDETME